MNYRNVPPMCEILSRASVWIICLLNLPKVIHAFRHFVEICKGVPWLGVMMMDSGETHFHSSFSLYHQSFWCQDYTCHLARILKSTYAGTICLFGGSSQWACSLQKIPTNKIFTSVYDWQTRNVNMRDQLESVNRQWRSWAWFDPSRSASSLSLAGSSTEDGSLSQLKGMDTEFIKRDAGYDIAGSFIFAFYQQA